MQAVQNLGFAAVNVIALIADLALHLIAGVGAIGCKCIAWIRVCIGIGYRTSRDAGLNVSVGIGICTGTGVVTGVSRPFIWFSLSTAHLGIILCGKKRSALPLVS